MKFGNFDFECESYERIKISNANTYIKMNDFSKNCEKWKKKLPNEFLINFIQKGTKFTIVT